MRGNNAVLFVLEAVICKTEQHDKSGMSNDQRMSLKKKYEFLK